MKQELLKGLSEEQIEKARNCKSREELLNLAREEGVELSDEQLAAVNGGNCRMKTPDLVCPSCGGRRIKHTYDPFNKDSSGVYRCTCEDCGTYFEVK